MPAAAGDHADHDRARAALQAGEILSLTTVLQRVAAEYPGQVLEVELERDAGRWTYEIKLLQPSGGLLKLEVDAANARVLKARSRQREAR
ncbi:MAG TPA: PepSY domain-containing protein [Burkholderiaceae bacterium]|nr:PepSY domain-containing protein [Burkholderiaceae bacterium]